MTDQKPGPEPTEEDRAKAREVCISIHGAANHEGDECSSCERFALALAQRGREEREKAPTDDVRAPLTDEELAALDAINAMDPRTEEGLRMAEDRARAYSVSMPSHVKYREWHATRRQDTGRLATEVRRLRSDEWLEKAAEEIAANHTMRWSPDSVRSGKAMLLAYLRKHRNKQ